jgi:hypothetical protein
MFAFTETVKWVEEDEGDDGKIIEGLKVKVPDYKLHDIAPYDYEVFLQLYWKNKSSGEFYRYTISISGQWIRMVKNVVTVTDGFGTDHRVVQFLDDIQTHFTITIEESGSEPLSANGEVDSDMADFYDLNYKKSVIKQPINISLAISNLPSLPDLPIGSDGLSYDATFVGFPDPNDEVDPTLGEEIFGDGETLEVGDLGVVDASFGESDWEQMLYNWTVEDGVWQSGYETLRINITSKFFDWRPFNEQIWISSDVSFPVKEYIYSNTSFETQNESYYMVMITDKTLQDNGFQSGDGDIPWGTCNGNEHFTNSHGLADLSSWKSDFVPESNDIDDSSFSFDVRDAVDYAVDNSQGLQDWLDEWNHGGRVMVNNARYNVTKTTADTLDVQNRAGRYSWNLTFLYTPTQQERQEVYDVYEETGIYEQPYWRYRVTVVNDVNKSLADYTEDMYITFQVASNRSRGRYTTNDFGAGMVSLASSEDVMRSYPELDSLLELDRATDEIEWEDGDSYSLAFLEMGSDTSLTGLLDTITGFSLPETTLSWAMQQGTVWEDGRTVSATVDAEDGRMVYYMIAEGTPLQALFAGM